MALQWKIVRKMGVHKPTQSSITLFMTHHIDDYITISSLPLMHLFEKVETPWDLLDQLVPFLDQFDQWKIESEVDPSVKLIDKDQIAIGKDVVIEPFALIKGPCILCDGAKIGHAALVRPYSIIGPNGVVGHASEVKSSILFANAKLPHFNYVGDSLIGCDVNLGAGAVCANVRLDESKVKCSGIDTGRKKFGAVIGDRSKIACNVVLNPGTLLKRDSKVYSKVERVVL